MSKITNLVDLKNRGIDVDCCFEIGDKECASLGDDKGFNGKTIVKI